MQSLPKQLTIGDLAERSGVAASALRYYESLGLISSHRTEGNQRRYTRDVLRRIAVIRAALMLGSSLDEIGDALDRLPGARTPNRRDWERLSARWRSKLDERIEMLEQLRDSLTFCIGCGCLSLRRCALFNARDIAAGRGPGARYLLGDSPDA